MTIAEKRNLLVAALGGVLAGLGVPSLVVVATAQPTVVRDQVRIFRANTQDGGEVGIEVTARAYAGNPDAGAAIVAESPVDVPWTQCSAACLPCVACAVNGWKTAKGVP